MVLCWEEVGQAFHAYVTEKGMPLPNVSAFLRILTQKHGFLNSSQTHEVKVISSSRTAVMEESAGPVFLKAEG